MVLIDETDPSNDWFIPFQKLFSAGTKSAIHGCLCAPPQKILVNAALVGGQQSAMAILPARPPANSATRGSSRNRRK